LFIPKVLKKYADINNTRTNIKELYMVQAISAIGYNPYLDPEYMRIIQELARLGLSPTGNKEVDKGRLQAAKEELARKVQDKFQEQLKQVDQVDMQRIQMEEQKLGVMTVAELNKILHGLF